MNFSVKRVDFLEYAMNFIAHLLIHYIKKLIWCQ